MTETTAVSREQVLETFRPELVLKAGGRIGEIVRPDVPEWVRQSVRVAPKTFAVVVPSTSASKDCLLTPCVPLHDHLCPGESGATYSGWGGESSM